VINKHKYGSQTIWDCSLAAIRRVASLHRQMVSIRYQSIIHSSRKEQPDTTMLHTVWIIGCRFNFLNSNWSYQQSTGREWSGKRLRRTTDTHTGRIDFHSASIVSSTGRFHFVTLPSFEGVSKVYRRSINFSSRHSTRSSYLWFNLPTTFYS